ncbi:MAG: hypothetical protein ABI596_16665 [Pyrinomonadaceae bacterium]
MRDSVAVTHFSFLDERLQLQGDSFLKFEVLQLEVSRKDAKKGRT